MFGDSAVLPVLRDIALPVLGRVPAFRRAMQMDLSETEIAYADGPLMELGGAGRHAHRAQVGGRALDVALPGGGSLWAALGGIGHTLLLFGAACGRDVSALLPAGGAPVEGGAVRWG